LRQTFVLAAAFALFGTTAIAQAQSAATGPVPQVLSSSDQQLYRQIFADERTGRFAEADALISRLDDRSLMGYVQAERYLSPYSHASIADLVEWMRQYSDLGVADRIYALAIRRASKPIRRHHRIVGLRVTVSVPAPAPLPPARGGGYEDSDLGVEPVSTPAARAAQPQIEANIRNDQPAAADQVLQALIASGGDAIDVARLCVRVAQSYIAEGQDFEAFDVASRPSGYARQSAPLLDWWAGIAAYRMGKFDVAAAHFDTLAQVGSVANWTRAAAAFWAARAYLANNQPDRVIPLLQAAAREQPTFYGLLAERALGQDTETGFRDPVIDAQGFNALMQIPAARRAEAAFEAGYESSLHGDMQRALAAVSYRQMESYAALAREMDQPDLELRASEMAASQGDRLTGLFPVPGYQPPGGYTVDPALVLAFVRIESRFQPNAVSWAGARGLMQVMPQTAKLVDGAPVDRASMNDPSYNLGLGQRYIEQLMDQLNGNLYQLAAAYNAGPGAVWHWMDSHPHDDALLFIEGIPVSETRNYVKKMMTYYWLYCRRTGEATPSLDQAAAGGWPTYQHMPAQGPVAPPPAAPAQPQQQPAPVVVSDAGLN